MRLLPSLREKQRYVVCKVESATPVSFSDTTRTVQEAVASFIGLQGMARAGVQILPERWDQNRQRLVVRVDHRSVDELKAALLLIKKIKNTSVIVRSVLVSGTLKKITPTT